MKQNWLQQLLPLILLGILVTCTQTTDFVENRRLNLLPDSSVVSPSIRILSLDEIAQKRNPEVFLPRNEYETKEEYSKRVSRQKQIMNNIRADLQGEYNAKEFEEKRLAEEKIFEEKQQQQMKIAESLTSIELTPSSIGTYDAEQGTFLLEVSEKLYTVPVPRNEARSFKENYASARIEGYKQLQNNLKDYEYFNLVVIHPILGTRLPFGPTKDIIAAPIIVSNKSIVPPNLEMRVVLIEPNGNGFLDAEERGVIKVSIANNGLGSAMGVIVELNTNIKETEVRFEPTKIIGEISAGQTKEVEFKINASKSVSRLVQDFTISASESYGFPPDPVALKFETYQFIPPKLELVDFGITTPNENNEIRPQTVTEVEVRIQNRGQGRAENVKFIINIPQGAYFTPESRTEYSFLSLEPGEFKDLKFSFHLSKTIDKTIKVSIGLEEKSTSRLFPLTLEVSKPQKTLQQLVVKGREIESIIMDDVANISVDVEKGIPTGTRNGNNDLAVVLGIESYKKIPGVSFAVRDAFWMKKYFESVLGIPADRIYYKTDSDVTLAVLNVAFGGWLKKRLRKDSNIFIYYAGHGAPDSKKNKAYLIPYDGDPNYAADSGIEMEAMYDRLSNLGASSVTVFLDACFSGANRNNEMLLAGARPVFIEVDVSATRDVTVFSAAGGKEISSAWPEKKHGLFSYFLMKGMRGEADANNDKKITVGELGNYIKVNVSDMAGMLDREQTPGLETLNTDNVIITY